MLERFRPRSPGPAVPPDSPATVPDAIKRAHAELARHGLETFLATPARLAWPRLDAPTVSVVMVLFNRAELTLRCLRSLTEAAGLGIEVVVVDNASTDRTAELLERLDGVRILYGPVNEGFVRGANRGAAAARGRHVLFLNNDAELLPGALEAALRLADADPGIGAVCGRLLMLDGRLQEAGSIVWSDGSCLGYGRGAAPDAPPYVFTRDVDYGSGALLLTPRAVFERLGGFAEEFAPAYYEDADYCLRLWREGLRVVYEPRATAIHYEFASSESMEQAVVLQIERRALLVERHADALRSHLEPGPGNVLAARSARRDRPRVLLVDDRVPHPRLGSGFPRCREMVLGLLALGWHVTLYPHTFAAEEWGEAYDALPHGVEIMLGAGTAGLHAFLDARRGHYDRVIVSRSHNLQALAALLRLDPGLLAGAPLVYDAEAITARREARRRLLSGEAVDESGLKRLEGEELALAREAAVVVAVSEAERQAFEAAGARATVTLGYAVEPACTHTPFEARDGLLFVGAVHDADSPNADALRWLATDILPRLRERRPDTRLIAPGAHLAEAVDLAAAGIDAPGPVRDLVPFYESARAFVAPTRYAAGLPLKLQHAAAHGVPIVCTSLLADQLGWRDEVEVLVADDAEGFAERCSRLLDDPALWARLRDAALERVRVECSRERFVDALGRALELARG